MSNQIKNFKIGRRVIGFDERPYFVADIGANHDGDLERARQLIALAKRSGADAVKFQNFQAAKIVSQRGFETLGNKVSHQAAWKKSVYEIYEGASISWDWTEKLKQACSDNGVDYFTTPYDFDSVDHVDPFVDVYKIGSGDITWTKLIEYIGSKGKPILLATGASTMEDVKRAMSALSFSGASEVCLMQCNTNYTTDKEKYKFVNLNVLKTYAKEYPETLLGLSDHTFGHATVVAAVSLGARVFEKHFTDDNTREGPDHKFAMNPSTWKAMVDNALEAFYALGDGVKRVEENELDSIIVQQRSIRATKDLEIGSIIDDDCIVVLRPAPAGSLRPFQYEEIVGKRLRVPVKKGDCLLMNHFEL